MIGEIKGHDVIIIDDMITTAGSMTQAIGVAYERGAKRVTAMASHGVLCGDAYQRIADSQVDELVLTDSIPLKRRFADLPITTLSVASLMGEAIKRIHTNQSISALFV